MVILPSHERFLQSRAQMLIMPVSIDGHISHPIVLRCRQLFAENYDTYHKKATSGELVLGDVLTHRLTRQLTGLGVQTNKSDYIANLVVQQFAERPISVRALSLCLNNLKPTLYELMRYKGLRRVALLGSALLVGHHDDATAQWLSPERILSVCQEVLGELPKLTMEVYFTQDTPLPTPP